MTGRSSNYRTLKISPSAAITKEHKDYASSTRDLLRTIIIINETTTTAATTTRTDQIKAYLIDQNISSEENLSDNNGNSSNLSPQYQALEFIAVADAMEMEIPTGKDKSTPEGYAFLTRYVLTVLYYATAGYRWTFDLNFLKLNGVCDWYSVLQDVDSSTEYRGVACENNEVVGLFLNKNNMEGHLPIEMGLLTTVINMDFDLNLLKGSIPDSFQALANMENIFMSDNRLTGIIPSWVDSLIKMRNINLSHNLLTGRLPTSLGRLPNMEGIALDNNAFSNSLSNVFDSSVSPGLRKLKQFYMENNQFTGTLDANFMKEMTSLEYLDISDNEFGGRIPSHLFELPELLVLDLHDNNFDNMPTQFQENTNLALLALHKCKFANQPIPTAISNLEGLQHLDLSQNMFTGEIPQQIRALNLSYLFLAQNDFAPGPIPPWILSMTSLQELSLKSTQRTGTIPFSFGTDLSQLILLDLDNNLLEGKIPLSLGYLDNLRILLLNRNNLTSAIPTTFAQLLSLNLIFLDANTEITGSLGDTFCNNSDFVLKPIIVADCDLCDPHKDCCTLCCKNGDECNDGIHVPDLDPIWQLGYQRGFFTFRREDYFMKEQYEQESEVAKGSDIGDEQHGKS